MVEEIIVTCGCGDTDKFAADAFKILFKDRPLPPISHEEGWLGNDRANQMVRALNKSKEKFAYYFNGEEVWDLLKGVRYA